MQSERVQKVRFAQRRRSSRECPVPAGVIYELPASTEAQPFVCPHSLSQLLRVCARARNSKSAINHMRPRDSFWRPDNKDACLYSLFYIAMIEILIVHDAHTHGSCNMHIHSWYRLDILFPIALTIEVELEWVFLVGRIIAMRNVEPNKGCFVALLRFPCTMVMWPGYLKSRTGGGKDTSYLLPYKKIRLKMNGAHKKSSLGLISLQRNFNAIASTIKWKYKQLLICEITLVPSSWY